MKKILHIILLLLIFIFIVVNVSHAQRGKIYQSMKSALVNPDSVYVLHLRLEDTDSLEKIANFKNLDSLEFYIFDNEKSKDLPRSFFELPNIKKLSHLKLPDDLKKYPQGLNRLTELKSLSFFGNKKNQLFEKFPKQLLELTNLESLDLSHCDIKTLPDSFSNLKRLKNLNLYFNELDAFPEVLCKLENLEELNIEFNNLTTLPESITKLTHLKYLNISNNLIQSLPGNLSELENLKKIELTYSENWSNHSPIIYSLLNLEELYISSPHMFDIKGRFEKKNAEEFPDFHLSDSITRLTNLKKLKIGYIYKLQTLPMGLRELNKLEELVLSSNRQLFKDSFPEVLFHLKNLKSLDLSSCYINEFPERLNKLNSLTHLNLGSNNLEDIPDFVFSLNKLIELNLKGNNLYKLPTEMLNLNNLNTLDLSYNKLTELSPELFSIELYKLYLDNNMLSTLPKEMSRLSELEVLRVSNNPFNRFPIIINELNQLKVLTCKIELSEEDKSVVESEFPLPLKNLKVLLINEEQLGNEERIKYIKQQMPHLRINGK